MAVINQYLAGKEYSTEDEIGREFFFCPDRFKQKFHSTDIVRYLPGIRRNGITLKTEAA
jgi:hypothetical protein